MPFGLVNAPATFQRAMDTHLSNLMFKSCVAYIDDVAVYSEGDFSQHLKALEEVFKRLVEAKIKLKPSKYKFARRSIKFLGHIIGGGKVTPDPEKIQVVALCSPPKDPEEIH
jgi:hypothetical protein